MRDVVLEDYLNYAATSACIVEGYGWKFIPAVENIIAFIERACGFCPPTKTFDVRRNAKGFT